MTSDLTLAGGFLKVFGLTDFKSSVGQNLVETSDYDNDGWESYEKTFQGWTAALTVWVRTQTGVLTPSYVALSDREVLFGDACRIGIRWYATVFPSGERAGASTRSVVATTVVAAPAPSSGRRCTRVVSPARAR